MRLRRTALRAHPRINASTQPAEGAGESKAAEAAYRPACLFGVYAFQLQELALLAMAACQPTNFFQMIPIQLWEPALPAMAACQPTNRYQMPPIQL